jgi:hypothetical protein
MLQPARGCSLLPKAVATELASLVDVRKVICISAPPRVPDFLTPLKAFPDNNLGIALLV